jgi:hypothetical protein
MSVNFRGTVDWSWGGVAGLGEDCRRSVGWLRCVVLNNWGGSKEHWWWNSISKLDLVLAIESLVTLVLEGYDGVSKWVTVALVVMALLQVMDGYVSLGVAGFMVSDGCDSNWSYSSDRQNEVDGMTNVTLIHFAVICLTDDDSSSHNSQQDKHLQNENSQIC